MRKNENKIAGGNPVAWRMRHGGRGPWTYADEKPAGPSVHLFEVQPLYAEPHLASAICPLCLNRGAVPEDEPPRKNTRWHPCSCHRPILDYGWGPLLIVK